MLSCDFDWERESKIENKKLNRKHSFAIASNLGRIDESNEVNPKDELANISSRPSISLASSPSASSEDELKIKGTG